MKVIRKVLKSLFSRVERSPASKHSFLSLTKDWDFYKCIEVLEKILTDNIIPFWYPEVIDLEHGGYKLNHDLKGNWKGRANKSLVTQARTLWFFFHASTKPVREKRVS